MTDRIQCEFFLLRYVPDAVKNEFVNIGVLLREAGRTAPPQFSTDTSGGIPSERAAALRARAAAAICATVVSS